MLSISEIRAFKDRLSPLSLPQLRAEIRGDNSLKREIERLYRQVVGLPLNKGCNDCYTDAAIVILTTKTEDIMAERKYILKNGVVLRHNKVNKATLYTYKNLTDEVAEALISAFGWGEEQIKKVFAYYPQPKKEVNKAKDEEKAAEITATPPKKKTTKKTAKKSQK